jgi:RNA-directed DNA polymerase
LEKAPDKTFIGRTEKGFDVLSDHFSPEGITVAAATVQRFVACATRLYEQERRKPEGFLLLGWYVRRWVRWARAWLGGAGVELGCESTDGMCHCKT